MKPSKASLTGVALAGAMSSVLLIALIGMIRSELTHPSRAAGWLVGYAAWLPSAVLGKGLLAYAWARQRIERDQHACIERPVRTAAILAVALALAGLVLSLAMTPLNTAYMRWLMERSVILPTGAWTMLPLLETVLVTMLSLALSWWAMTAALMATGERNVFQAATDADADVAPAARWWFAAAFLAFTSSFVPNVSASTLRVLGSSTGRLTVLLCLLPAALVAYACAHQLLRRPMPAMHPLRLAACAGVAALLSVAIFALLPLLLLLWFVSFGNLLHGGAGVWAFPALALLFLVPAFPSVLLALRLYRSGLPTDRPQPVEGSA